MKREFRYRWKDSPYRLDEAVLERLGQSFEISFYEAFLEKDPDHIPSLFALGELYTQAGRVAQGLAVDEKLSDLFPYEPVVHYNLACSLSLAGRRDEAVDTLRKAVNLGYDDFDTLTNDSDFDNIRDHPKFLELLLSVRNSHRA